MDAVSWELLAGGLCIAIALLGIRWPGLLRGLFVAGTAFVIGLPLYWLHNLGRSFWAWVGHPVGNSLSDIGFLIFTGMLVVAFFLIILLAPFQGRGGGYHSSRHHHYGHNDYDPDDPSRPEYMPPHWERDD